MRNCYRWTALLCAALAVVLTCGGCARLGSPPEGRSLTLAERGQTGFTIVIAEDASPSTRYGASELQHYLREITGAEFPVQTDAVPMGTQEIILGDSKHLRQLGMQVDFDALGDEGYVLRTAGPLSATSPSAAATTGAPLGMAISIPGWNSLVSSNGDLRHPNPEVISP